MVNSSPVRIPVRTACSLIQTELSRTTVLHDTAYAWRQRPGVEHARRDLRPRRRRGTPRSARAPTGTTPGWCAPASAATRTRGRRSSTAIDVRSFRFRCATARPRMPPTCFESVLPRALRRAAEAAPDRACARDSSPWTAHQAFHWKRRQVRRRGREADDFEADAVPVAPGRARLCSRRRTGEQILRDALERLPARCNTLIICSSSRRIRSLQGGRPPARARDQLHRLHPRAVPAEAAAPARGQGFPA